MRVSIIYDDGRVEVIDIKAGILDGEQRCIKIVHHNDDLQFINYDKVISYTLINENDTDKGTT